MHYVAYTNIFNPTAFFPENFDSQETNKILGKISARVYQHSKQIYSEKINSKFNREMMFHENKVFCFFSSDSYKLLYSRLTAETIGIDEYSSQLNEEQVTTINDFDVNFIFGNCSIALHSDETKDYKVVSSFDAFQNYATMNGFTDMKNACKLFFDDFIDTLLPIDPNTQMNDFGYVIKKYDLPHVFQYINFNNTIIVTNYFSSNIAYFDVDQVD